MAELHDSMVHVLFMPPRTNSERHGDSSELIDVIDDGGVMPYITTHRLIAPIIREDNRAWRQQGRRQGKSLLLAELVADYKRRGGRIKKIPYQGDFFVWIGSQGMRDTIRDSVKSHGKGKDERIIKADNGFH